MFGRNGKMLGWDGNGTNTEMMSCEVVDSLAPVDVGWILKMGMIVLQLQGGIALLEIGSTRTLSSMDVFTKNFSDLVIGAIVYYLIGFGFADGESWMGFIGRSGFAPGMDFPRLDQFFFSLAFASTASTIDSGAVVERMTLLHYILLSALVSGWIYPTVHHWVWNSEGWLNQLGFIDLSGATAVHMVGGASGFVSAYKLGPRLAYFDNEGVPKGFPISGDKIRLSYTVFKGKPVFVMYGTLLIMFAFYGLGLGNIHGVHGSNALVASRVVFNLTVGASFAGLVGCAIAQWRYGYLNIQYCATSMIAGLVSMTGGAHVYGSVAAVILGILAGTFSTLSIIFLEKKGIDDPVRVVSMHCIGGFIGAMGPGFFARADFTCDSNPIDSNQVGLLYGGGIQQVVTQFVGVIAVLAWVSMNVLAFFLFFEKVLHRSCRITPIEEAFGCDTLKAGVNSLLVRLRGQDLLAESWTQISKERKSILLRNLRDLGGSDMDLSILEIDSSEDDAFRFSGLYMAFESHANMIKGDN